MILHCICRSLPSNTSGLARHLLQISAVHVTPNFACYITRLNFCKFPIKTQSVTLLHIHFNYIFSYLFSARAKAKAPTKKGKGEGKSSKKQPQTHRPKTRSQTTQPDGTVFSHTSISNLTEFTIDTMF